MYILPEFQLWINIEIWIKLVNIVNISDIWQNPAMSTSTPDDRSRNHLKEDDHKHRRKKSSSRNGHHGEGRQVGQILIWVKCFTFCTASEMVSCLSQNMLISYFQNIGTVHLKVNRHRGSVCLKDELRQINDKILDFLNFLQVFNFLLS